MSRTKSFLAVAVAAGFLATGLAFTPVTNTFAKDVAVASAADKAAAKKKAAEERAMKKKEAAEKKAMAKKAAAEKKATAKKAAAEKAAMKKKEAAERRRR